MTNPFVVSSPKQLQVIASPGREEIIDMVALIGPCRITELASVVGRSRNSLYYHVRALRDAGLLLETHRSGEGVRTTAYYDVPGRPLSVRFDLSTPSRRRAVLTLARTRIRSAARGFERACKPGVVTLKGPRQDLRVTHLKGWLSDNELEETNRLLERLVELVGSTERGATKKRKSYEITFVLAPVNTAARQSDD
jgi:DNA-binding transcriptional ArsR family regulator